MAGLEGARLGAYELIERIGGGGMADVYRAKQTTAFDREVAVKVIRSGFSEDQMFRERFLREAQAIAKLSHPNILPLIEFGQERDILYLVMPYAPGGTLRDLISRMNGPLSLNDTVEIFTQLCDAVQYAHEQGIVHRDIKPQNVLIQRGKHLLLADFGIARDTASDTKLTMTGAGVGTVEYMAPEQAMGRSDTRSDLYSLGIVLYQMLTGRVPFGGSTPFAIMMQQANEPLTPPRSLNPALPREVDGILEMALAKDPTRRFQSASSLLRAVQSLQQTGRSHNDMNLAPGSAPDLQRSASARSGPPSSAGTGERGYAASRSGPGSGAGFSPASGSPPSLPRGARPGGPAFSTWDDAAPTRQRSPESGFYGDQGGRAAPPGWGGRPSGPPPPAYPQNDTFMADAPPPRRPTNPGYGYGGSPSRPGSTRAGVDPQAWGPIEPKKRGNFWLLLAAAVLLIAALGIGGVVVVNLKNKQHTANQPGIAQTTTGTAQTSGPTATPVPPAKASYAFMSNFQIFVSLQGQTPKQFTNIPEVGQPNAALGSGVNTDFLASPLLFSPDGRYVAGLIQIVDAPRDGIFGGNLYIVDTQTGKVIQPTEPGSTKPLFSNGGANAISWKDAHTLIIAGDPSTTHVRAYDINTDSYTVAFNPVNPPAGSVIVRDHYIFYSCLVPESGSGTTIDDLILHRYDINSKADQALFKLGSITLVDAPGPPPEGYAPFDISPDGTHVLWRDFALTTNNKDGLWYAGIDGSNPKQLLKGIALAPNGYTPDAPIFSPDGKKALIETTNAVYTVNLDGSNLQKYVDFGQPDWLPDSSGITIVVSSSGSSGPKDKTDQCKLSDGTCSLLLNNASGFYWQK